MAYHGINTDAGCKPRGQKQLHWQRELYARCALGLTLTGLAAVGASLFAACSNSPSTQQTCSGDLAIGFGDLHGQSLPEKTLALTFDDGPGLRTSELSSYLKSQGIRATFFVMGQNVTDPSILAQLSADGHLIGNHTWDHASITGKSTNTQHLSAAQTVDELTQVDTIISPFNTDNHFLFRAPYGDFDVQATNDINASPMKKYVGPINWDIGDEMGPGQAADWACWHPPANADGSPGTPTPPTQCGDLYAEQIDTVGHGIVLMHDPYFINDDPAQGGTVDMIQYLVPILKSKGYQFARVDEVPDIAALFPPPDTTPEAGADDQDGGSVVQAPADASSGEPAACPASPQDDDHVLHGESGNLLRR
ncbi:MAG: polysaccharide deacetylase family protein [Polyangiaceae bacterium]|nr:polysaccharide deacetylase family protein [Polyangiaceae bacterium]